MLTFIIAFSNINYNCMGVGVLKDMPVEGGLAGLHLVRCFLMCPESPAQRKQVISTSTWHTTHSNNGCRWDLSCPALQADAFEDIKDQIYDPEFRNQLFYLP